jgi:hypothetical protein
VSILSDFEDRIGRAVEGGFAAVFRSPVQPAELAHKLGREMDRGRVVGVGKVYAPTLYNVLLSPADDEKLGGFAETLAGELETYLVGYARERGYALETRPVVRFLVDEELKLGRFEVIGELLSPSELAEELGEAPGEVVPRDSSAPAQATPASMPLRAAGAPGGVPGAPPLGPIAPVPVSAPKPPTGVLGANPASRGRYSTGGHPSGGYASGGFDSAPRGPEPATVTVGGIGHDVALRGERVVVGRLSSCEIALPDDANVSREHAAFVPEGDGWAIEDLGSTNGTSVNGRRVGRVALVDGDVIDIGVTELVYHAPRGASA